MHPSQDFPSFVCMHTNSQELQFESHFKTLEGGDKLHVKRIYSDPKGEPVLLIHGFFENGMIFYTESGKGYAPFLARNGYDVFVADLRGRGKSEPRINRHSDFGQQEFLSEEMPAFLELIRELKGDRPVHWGAHSWGGVMLLAYLAVTDPMPPVASLVLFGAKRRISVRNWQYYTSILLGWRFIAPLAISWKGYLDAITFKMGADNESKRVFAETAYWVKEKEWRHWTTGWDFAAALQAKKLPPVLYFAGKKDKVLGHPTDVTLLANETGDQVKRIHLLSVENGHALDYGHINMLIHPKAAEDVFPFALEWMQEFSTNHSQSRIFT